MELSCFINRFDLNAHTEELILSVLIISAEEFIFSTILHLVGNTGGQYCDWLFTIEDSIYKRYSGVHNAKNVVIILKEGVKFSVSMGKILL